MNEFDKKLENIPMMIALAVLIDRLGGEVYISQADIDKIAYNRLLEGWRGDDVALKLDARVKAS